MYSKIRLLVLAKLSKLRVKRKLFAGLRKNFFDRKLPAFFLGRNLRSINFLTSIACLI